MRAIRNAFIPNIARFVAVLLLSTNVCLADDVRLIVTGALFGAFRDLVPEYERQTGDHLMIAWGPSSGTSARAIPVRVKAEPFDAVITSKAGLDDLVSEGLVDSATRADLVRSGVGIAVSKHLPKPDVSNIAALKRVLQEAKSIGYSEGSSGVYVSTALVDRLGLGDDVKQKFKKIVGKPVGKAVVDGEVEIGMQQISELRAVPDIQYCGALPEAVQNYVVFSGALSRKSDVQKGARAFLTFLQSSAARPYLLNSGLELPNGSGL